MKTQQTVSVSLCDFCGKPGSFNYCSSCDACGADICSDCKKTHAHEYPHGVFFSGSDDALYCNECDARLKKSGDERMAAYLKIERLREECRLWNEDFKQRKDAAEADVKRTASFKRKAA